MNFRQLLSLLLLAVFFLTTSCRKTELASVGSAANYPPKLIVVLGASTAVGWGASNPDSGWVGRLKARFKSDNRDYKLINLAVPGFTTYNVLPSGYKKIGRSLPDTNSNVTKAIALKPDLVLINLPSNDIANGYDDIEILNNFAIITKTLGKKSIPFILTGTQPRNLSELLQRTRLKSLNDSLASRYGDSISNYYSVLSTTNYQIRPQYSAGDGIHLNNSGHKVIYEAFMRQVLFRKILKY